MDQVKGGRDRDVLCGRVSDGNNGKKDKTVPEICKKLQLSTMQK